MPPLGWKIPGFGSEGQLGCSGAMAEPVPTLCRCTDPASEEVLGPMPGMVAWWHAGVVGCRDYGPGHALLPLQGRAWLQTLSCPSKRPLTPSVGIFSWGGLSQRDPAGSSRAGG